MSNKLLQRLVVVYGKPDTTDVRAYFEEIGKMLVKYSDAILDDAADLIIRTHRGRSFPTPAQIVTACEDSLPVPTPVQTKLDPAWSSEAIATANRLTESEMGYRACQEGWIIGLHDFCRKHRRLPCPIQISDIRKESAFVTRCAEGREDMGSLRGPLVRLAHTFLDKRAEHAARIERAFAKMRDAAP